jgi:phospholipid/cholesterol/gamma-HCH transport system substrate-binding protein
MMSRLRAYATAKVALLGLVLVAILGAVLLVLPGSSSTTLVVYFESTNGIYAGDEVRVLGVPVGKVDDITPEDDRVRVEIAVDSDVKVPADAQAAIVAPSLVSSRYVQLAPQYAGGPQLEEGDVIPIDRTAVPVEWDEIKAQLNDLSVALGPNGANRSGALSQLISSSADALDGEGASINQTIAQLSAAVDTLDGGSTDTFTTVRNLQVFVSALAGSDQQLAEFSERLDAVSGLLAKDKGSVRAAMGDLSAAVVKVERFVRTNRKAIKETLVGLGDVSSVVARQQEALAQTLHVAPNALANLIESYHQRQNAVGVDIHGANINSPGQLLCGALAGAAGAQGQAADALCGDIVGDLLDQLTGGPAGQSILEMIRNFLGGAL